MEFWQVFATSSVVAAGVTLAVNRLLKMHDDEQQRRATKQAIQAEIDFASEFAASYLDPAAVRSPIHRITTAFYEEGAPKLIALGCLNYQCSKALLIYYNNIAQMNRSLDVVLGLHKPEDATRKQKELKRVFLKACSLVPRKELHRIASAPELDPLEARTIRRKLAKYGARSPYDEVKAHMGLV